MQDDNPTLDPAEQYMCLCSYLAEMVWPLQCTFTLSNLLNSPQISQLMFLQRNSGAVSIILSKTLKSSTLISDFDYRERFAECY